MKKSTPINPTAGGSKDVDHRKSAASQAPYSIIPDTSVAGHVVRTAQFLQQRQPQPQQQQQGVPSTDEIKGKWKQQVGAAKIMWGKLTEDELLKLEGHQQKLAGLVQERYAITRDEANKQVQKFFEQNKH